MGQMESVGDAGGAPGDEGRGVERAVRRDRRLRPRNLPSIRRGGCLRTMRGGPACPGPEVPSRSDRLTRMKDADIRVSNSEGGRGHPSQ